MDYKETLATKAKVAELKKNARTKAQLKSLEAQFHQHRGETQAATTEFTAYTENAHRGMRTVERGDGSAIEFKDGMYRTNDAAEAKLLESLGDVTVERTKQAQERHGRMFSVPALPWKGDAK